MKDFILIYCIASCLLLIFVVFDMFIHVKKINDDNFSKMKKYISAKSDLIFFLIGVIFVLSFMLILNNFFVFM